jgi:peptidoglycan/LPS O-acetylase OafA/YrhL
MSGAGFGGGGRAERQVFPLFDSLRAIAALTIFGYHIAASQNEIGGTWLGNLNVGVPIFFVVSGFLPTASGACSASCPPTGSR